MGNKPRKYTQVNKVEVLKVLKKLKDTHTAKQIAEAAGVTRNTINEYARNYGVKIKMAGHYTVCATRQNNINSIRRMAGTKTPAEMAEILGISSKTIVSYASTYSISLVMNGKKEVQDKIDAAVKAHHKEMSAPEIARLINVHVERIYSTARKMGVATKPHRQPKEKKIPKKYDDGMFHVELEQNWVM